MSFDSDSGEFNFVDTSEGNTEIMTLRITAIQDTNPTITAHIDY